MVTEPDKLEPQMKDFPNAAFAPDVIEAMDKALQKAVETLPHPVSSERVKNSPKAS